MIFSGGLITASNIRPNKLFTADVNIVAYKAGSVKLQKMKNVAATIVDLVSV